MSDLTVNCKFNIAIMGGTSSGKTTFVQGILGMAVSDDAIIKPSLFPQIYELAGYGEDSLETVRLRSKQADDKHKAIPWCAADGAVQHNVRAAHDIASQIDSFSVGSSQINYAIRFHDFPGLNGRNRAEYFKYIDQNFEIFDMIIFIIDVNSPLETPDEMDSLHLVLKNMVIHPCRLTILVNKCDKLVETVDPRNSRFVVQNVNSDSRELANGRIVSMIDELTRQYGLNKYRMNIQYYSSMSVYMARLFRYGSSQVDPSLQEKFFTEQYGAEKWNSMNKLRQQRHINSFRKDAEIKYIKHMQNYGFTELFGLIIIVMNCDEVMQNRYIKNVIDLCLCEMKTVVDLLQNTGEIPSNEDIGAKCTAYVEILRKFVKPCGNQVSCLNELKKRITGEFDWVVRANDLPNSVESCVYILWSRMLSADQPARMHNSSFIFCTILLSLLNLQIPRKITFKGTTSEKLTAVAIWCQRFQSVIAHGKIDRLIRSAICMVYDEFQEKNPQFDMTNVIACGKLIDRFFPAEDRNNTTIFLMHNLLHMIINKCIEDTSAVTREYNMGEETITDYKISHPMPDNRHNLFMGDVTHVCAPQQNKPWVLLTWMLMGIDYTEHNGTNIFPRSFDTLYRNRLLLNFAVSVSRVFEPNEKYNELMKYC